MKFRGWNRLISARRRPASMVHAWANPLLPAEEEAEAFTFEEFVRRTAQRAGTDPTVAEIAVDADTS